MLRVSPSLMDAAVSCVVAAPHLDILRRPIRYSVLCQILRLANVDIDDFVPNAICALSMISISFRIAFLTSVWAAPRPQDGPLRRAL